MTTRDHSRLPVGEPATAIFLDDYQESAPVFVDDSGRRRRRFRMVGVAGVGICACFIALAIVGMVGHGPFEGIRLPGLSATTRSARHPARPAPHAPGTTVGGRKAARVDAAGGLRSTTPTAAPQAPVATPTSRAGTSHGNPALGAPSTPPTTTVATPVTPTTTANHGHTTVAPGPSKSRGNGLLNGHGPTTSPTTVPHGNAKSTA